MKIIENGLQFPINLSLWNMCPVQIAEEACDNLRENHAAKVMQIRYAAMEFCASEYFPWEDRNFTRDEIENDSYICDNRLYLNGGEGYQLDDDKKLSYIYLNTDGRICAAVYLETDDDFIYYNLY